MKPTSFLKSVAMASLSHYGDLADLCFVFPNKRAGTFFLKALSQSVGQWAVLAPEVLPVSDFMSRVSGREVASRIDLLFRLYKIYRALMQRSPEFTSEADLLEFDRFAPWGETLLSDFTEIDKYDADAHQLLMNVRNLRDIESNFLTPEQCDALERLLGRRPVAADVESFWKTVLPGEGEAPDENGDGLKPRFLKLWKLMPELYDELQKNLEADGLTTPGGSFRLAMERVLRDGNEGLPWRGIVAVGFNHLSTSEAKLFDELRDLRKSDGTPYAEFFWDCTGPVLGEGSESGAAALSMMRRYMRRYPMPQWSAEQMALCSATGLPATLQVAAAPSNAAQVKIAAMRVDKWIESLGADTLQDARAAVVIPDENLLLPLIHSLPADKVSVNLTMGYSMRYTAVASFVYHLRRLQSHRRKWRGDTGFWHEDFKLFLSHPLVHVCIGSNLANEMRGEMGEKHMRIVSSGWIAAHSPVLAEMLRPLPADGSVSDTINYISQVLLLIDSHLTDNNDESAGDRDESSVPLVNTRMERMLIQAYLQALSQLESSVMYHGIQMSAPNVLHMVDKLLAGETVSFQGEPLQGLQVMGLLETRALDFDHLVILSMNDKIMPRRAAGRSFIPASIRRGYGLPGPNHAEDLYTYYFYRLLSRASDVTLVYDARAGEGMRSGGKSRFLMQLDLLHTASGIKETVYSFALKSTQKSPQPVEKTEEVMRLLSQYTLTEEGRNLSASALMNYCSCPVLFYYKNVVGLDDKTEARDYLDPITQGNVVHDTLLQIYMPDHRKQRIYLTQPRLITREFLEELLSEGNTVIDDTVRRAVNRYHFHLPYEECDRELTGSAEITARWLAGSVRNVLGCDLKRAPFEYAGGEIHGKMRMKFGDAPEINISYSLDRLDIVQEGGQRVMRIVDYKTGSSPMLKATDSESIFNGSHDSHYLLQLLTYAQLLKVTVPPADLPLAEHAAVLLLDVNAPAQTMEIYPVVGKDRITDSGELCEEFLAGMERILNDIFDPTQPFTPRPESEDCRNCAFKRLCGLE